MTSQIWDQDHIPEITILQEQFYHDVFDIDVDLSQLYVPDPRDDIWFPMIMAATLPVLVETCRRRMGYSQWAKRRLDLICKSDRSPSLGHYAILRRDSQSADQVHRRKSAEQVRHCGITAITIEEAITCALFAQWSNRLLPDTEGETLCAGTLIDGYLTPRIRSRRGVLEVHNCGAIGQCLDGSIREVIPGRHTAWEIPAFAKCA